MSNTPIAKGFNLLNPGPLDSRRGPYPTTAAANLAIPNTTKLVDGLQVNYRDGVIVDIGTPGNYIPHTWRGGFADGNIAPYIAIQQSDIGKTTTPTGNQIFNYTADGVFTDQLLDANGALGVFPNSIVSRVKVDPSRLYITISGVTNFSGGSKNARFADVNGNLIAGTATNIQASKTLAIPSNAIYFDFRSKNDINDTGSAAIMINYGQNALALSAYTSRSVINSLQGNELKAASASDNATLEKSGDNDNSIPNKAKVKEILNNNSAATNLLFNDRWTNGVAVLDSSSARFTKGDGFSYGDADVFTTIDAYPAFGYIGKAVNAQIGGQNFYYFIDSKKLLADPNYTGNIYVVLEIVPTTSVSLDFRIFRVTGSTTETQVSSQNIAITAGVVNKVVLTPLNLLGTDTAANVKGLELRIFGASGALIAQTLKIGRVMISTVLTTDLEFKTDYPMIQRAANKQVSTAAAVQVTPSTNLLLNDRWLNGFKVMPSDVANVKFTVGDAFNYDTTNNYSLIDALPVFGYTGKAINADIKSGNFFYFVDAKKVLTDPNFADTVYVVLELMATITVNVTLRIYRVTNVSTETQAVIQNITLTAGVATKVIVTPFSLLGADLASNIRGFEIRWFAPTSNFNQVIKIGRIAVTTTSNTDFEVKNDYPIIIRAAAKPANASSTTSGIFRVGDSLTAQDISDFLSAISGRNVTVRGYGGQKSFQIRDHFIENISLVANNVVVIWVGRNNMGDLGMKDVVFEDVRTMVNLIPHRKFIVMGVINAEVPAEYKGGATYIEMEALNSKLKEVYGPNYIDIRRCIIDIYNYGGIKLTASFVQPALNGTVNVSVNDTSFFTAGESIRIGYWSSADRYTLTTINSATSMTLTLTQSNRVASGGTVDNATFNYSDTTPYPSIGYLKVVKDQDFTTYTNDITPSSLRKDGVHLKQAGYDLVSEQIQRRIQALNF